MKLSNFLHLVIGAVVFIASAKYFSSSMFYNFFVQHSSVVAAIMSFVTLFLYAILWHIVKTSNELRKYHNDER